MGLVRKSSLLHMSKSHRQALHLARGSQEKLQVAADPPQVAGWVSGETTRGLREQNDVSGHRGTSDLLFLVTASRLQFVFFFNGII